MKFPYNARNKSMKENDDYLWGNLHKNPYRTNIDCPNIPSLKPK